VRPQATIHGAMCPLVHDQIHATVETELHINREIGVRIV
jgi:hypothetical protein